MIEVLVIVDQYCYIIYNNNYNNKKKYFEMIKTISSFFIPNITGPIFNFT